MTARSRLSLLLPALALAACGGHDGSSRGRGAGAATAAGARTASSAPPSIGSAAPGASPGAAPAGGGAPAGASGSGPVLHGTFPPDPTTGFDGVLWLVGERLVPGSTVLVTVNGVPTKVLPGLYVNAQTLGVYVYLTVAADYELSALAPDGTTSTPARVTVPDGGFPALTGQGSPRVDTVFPPSFDPTFAGTVWITGDGFMPGSLLLVSYPGGPPAPLPLLVVNERTAGWAAATPLPGDLTLTVVNPTGRTSAPITVTVQGGTPPATGPTPTLAAPPPPVASPFVGPLQLYGTGFLPGAWVELRPRGAQAAASVTPLLWSSSSEVSWVLLYPQPGAYEVRVVNPNGAATGWVAFDVS